MNVMEYMNLWLTQWWPWLLTSHPNHQSLFPPPQQPWTYHSASCETDSVSSCVRALRAFGRMSATWIISICIFSVSDFARVEFRGISGFFFVRHQVLLWALAIMKNLNCVRVNYLDQRSLNPKSCG